MNRKTLLLASLSTIVCVLASGAHAQEAFTSSKFLTYAADAQKSYIGTAAVAATTIASLNSESQAKCLGAWMVEHGQSGYGPVIDAMTKYPDDHPMGLILAVLQKACGSLKWKK